MGLIDFFTPEAGQKRRNWLDAQLGGMWEYVPPELRPFVALGNEMNPVTSIERAGQDARRVVAPNVSGWDRMAAAGDMASNMAGVVAPAVAASKGAVPAVQAAEDALMGWSASSPMAFAARDFVTDEFGGVGFRAYHGSPHDFDRFSLDKIGTGEGAQAYGHGLYFAEAEDVAKQYRDQLSRGWKPSEDYMWRGKDAASHYQDAISRGDYGKALVWEQVQLHGTRDAIRQDLLDEIAGGSNQAKAALEFLNTLPDELFAKPSGRMYEVQINADPNDFLDWDKPLSEQGAKVQDVLRSFGAKPDEVGAGAYNRAGIRRFAVLGPDGRWGPGGATFEESLASAGGDAARVRQTLDPSAPNRSEGLRQAGIPGIRYLDAGSRGAGDGSRNYVVFDDKLIEILRKYGLVPGMIGAGAYGMQPTEAQAGQ